LDVVEVVDDNEPDAGLDGHRQFFVGLRVAVHDDLPRIDSAGLCRHEFAATRDIRTDAFLGHQAVDRRAGERRGREHHA